jgi:hypothetical protein
LSKDFADGNFECKFIIIRPGHEGAVMENATIGSLAGIEPMALRFRCSTLTN